MLFEQVREGDRIGTKLITPKGVVGYYQGKGKGVVNFSTSQILQEGDRLYPQIVHVGAELKWQVTDAPCNCHNRTKLVDTNNC